MPTETLTRPLPVAQNGQQPTDTDEEFPKLRNYGVMLQSEMKKHVIGQDRTVFAVVAAALTGINLCLVGKPGTGKTHSAETLMKILGFKGGTLPLHPDITAFDILGNMILDFETNKKVYSPSPFLGDDLDNLGIVLDELNRSSDKGQAALLDVIDKKRVIVDKKQYDLSDVYTVVMTMNPPECNGTKPLFSALADRIDYTLAVSNPPQEDLQAIIKYNRLQPPVECIFGHRAQAPNGSLAQVTSRYEAEAVLRDCRQTFNYHFSTIDDKIDELASIIVDAFQGDEWVVPATARTGVAIAKMATVVSFMYNAGYPKAKHVWQVAPGCLGMLQPTDWMTTDDRLKRINDRLTQLRDKIG